MSHIGEFQKDSMILLELLTKSKENVSIPMDFAPTAVIEHSSRNGIVQVDSVKLETMGDKSNYTKSYRIPSNWEAGMYIITYHATVNGRLLQTKESFKILEPMDLVQESFKAMAVEPVVDDTENQVISDADDYVMPSDFQTPSSIVVEGKRLTITLTGNALYNNTYSVVLNKELKSLSGNTLGKTKILTFTSEYKPLYSTPLEVQSLLRSISKYFTPHDYYSAIKDASQKALQMKGNVPDPNNARYRELRSNDTTLFSTQKFVMYQAARTLLASLMVKILDNNADDDGDGNGGIGTIKETGGNIKLGDFSVSDGSSSSGSGLGTSNAKKEETPLEKLKALLREVEKELKFWQDAMMGHNRRGYAKPLSGSYRSGAGTPEGRDFA